MKNTGRATAPNTTISLSNCLSRKPGSIKREYWRFWRLQALDYLNTTIGEREADAPSAFFNRRSSGYASWNSTRRRLSRQKSMRKPRFEHGSPFTWSPGESLEDLGRPERREQIRRDHEQRLARMRAKILPNPLRTDCEPVDIDDLYGQAKV